MDKGWADMQRKATTSEKKAAANRKNGFQPGKSGNPAGRRSDQEYKDAVSYLKGKSKELMEKAVAMAMDGKEKVMCAILSKICPDKLDVGGELSESMSAIAQAILSRQAQP
jgi:hypothetical protein